MFDPAVWLWLVPLLPLGASVLIAFVAPKFLRPHSHWPRVLAAVASCAISFWDLLADNFLLLYAFWEGVGLCSYLLIGFWFTKPSAAAAARKAFLVTRLGDVGFLLGIFLLWYLHSPHSVDFAAVFDYPQKYEPLVL